MTDESSHAHMHVRFHWCKGALVHLIPHFCPFRQDSEKSPKNETDEDDIIGEAWTLDNPDFSSVSPENVAPLQLATEASLYGEVVKTTSNRFFSSAQH